MARQGMAGRMVGQKRGCVELRLRRGCRNIQRPPWTAKRASTPSPNPQHEIGGTHDCLEHWCRKVVQNTDSSCFTRRSRNRRWFPRTAIKQCNWCSNATRVDSPGNVRMRIYDASRISILNLSTEWIVQRHLRFKVTSAWMLVEVVAVNSCPAVRRTQKLNRTKQHHPRHTREAVQTSPGQVGLLFLFIV